VARAHSADLGDHGSSRADNKCEKPFDQTECCKVKKKIVEISVGFREIDCFR
jgi:hypothetical protein